MSTEGTGDPGARVAPRGALRDVRVVEFGQYVAAPLAGMLLADQGADVIKVERPSGDPARDHPAFDTWNRGKRSVVIDLRTRSGQADAATLVRSADVVIENFRPGVAERLGIGYERLSRRHRSLVFCALPGYPVGHPAREEQAWEPLVGARTGLYQPVDITSRTVSDGRPKDRPQFTPLHLPSTYAAMHAATAITAALIRARETGLGCRIEAPLHNGMFTAMGRVLVAFDAFEPEETFTWPRRVMARAYRCADGRSVQLHGMWPRFARQTLTALDRSEWITDAEALFGRDVDAATVDLWIERFEQLFLTRPALEWERMISAAGGACTVMRTVDEWAVTDHARESGIVVERIGRDGQSTVQPGLQVHLRSRPGRIRGAAPALGADTARVLRACRDISEGDAPTPVRRPRQRLPLDGVRVLDLSVILAGPSCGRALAEFGADVIKIDDPTHLNDPAGYLDVNRGKRSILIDLKTAEGKEIFWRLVETADVVVENYRRGSLDRLGIGYEAVGKRRPSIVYASMNCHGYDGPWRDRPGWEQSAQAATGIQVMQGGGVDRPKLLHFPISDYGTGLMGAYAVMLALLARQRSGRGQRVDTGLSPTATLVLSSQLAALGRSEDAPSGPRALGGAEDSRMFETLDGWIYVHCANSAQSVALCQLPDQGAVGGALERWFGSQTSASALEHLAAADIPAAPVFSFADCRDDPFAAAAGLVVTRDHPHLGVVTHLGTTVAVAPTPLTLGRPAPVPGLDTTDILRDLGFAEATIDELFQRGVIGGAQL